MTNWGSIIASLTDCIEGVSGTGVIFSNECIEAKIVPVIAEDVINQISTVVISGTNPPPKNRSWSQVNKGAIALIVIMCIVTVAVIALVVLCVVCARRVTRKSSSEASDSEMPDAVSNPLGREAVQGNRQVARDDYSRSSSRYGVSTEKSTIEEASVGPIDDSLYAPTYSHGDNPPTRAAAQTSRAVPVERTLAPAHGGGSDTQRSHPLSGSQQPRLSNAQPASYQYAPSQQQHQQPYTQPAQGYQQWDHSYPSSRPNKAPPPMPDDDISVYSTVEF